MTDQATAIPALLTATPIAATPAAFGERDSFELALRKAKVYSSSSLVPQQYQGNIANCLIALNMARRIGADELMVMQNLFLIGNRPGWSAQFLIATFNQCGRFSAMRFEERGGPDEKKTWGCRAYATERGTRERIEGPWVTWQMVEGEGWNKRSGSKWLTIPDLMFRYRAGAFLVRTHAPEIAMGLPTVEELRDVIDVTPESSAGSKSEAIAKTLRAAREGRDGASDNGEIVSIPAGGQSEAPSPRATYAEVADALNNATTDELLQIAEDLIRAVDPAQVTELKQLAAARRVRINEGFA